MKILLVFFAFFKKQNKHTIKAALKKKKKKSKIQSKMITQSLSCFCDNYVWSFALYFVSLLIIWPKKIDWNVSNIVSGIFLDSCYDKNMENVVNKDNQCQ